MTSPSRFFWQQVAPITPPNALPHKPRLKAEILTFIGQPRGAAPTDPTQATPQGRNLDPFPPSMLPTKACFLLSRFFHHNKGSCAYDLPTMWPPQPA
ncbi:hypothetical protein L6R29_14425 [Myxococcota bacterium]|nr:hypothetical protein [Myxococcota bacterium]